MTLGHDQFPYQVDHPVAARSNVETSGSRRDGDILDVLEPSVLAVVQRWEVELRWVDARKVHRRSQGRCAGRVHPTGEGPDQREFPGVAARLVGELRAASPLAA